MNTLCDHANGSGLPRSGWLERRCSHLLLDDRLPSSINNPGHQSLSSIDDPGHRSLSSVQNPGRWSLSSVDDPGRRSLSSVDDPGRWSLTSVDDCTSLCTHVLTYGIII